jgi:hypothetical protein
MVPLGREMIPRPRCKLNRAARDMKNPILVLEIEENTETFLNLVGTKHRNATSSVRASEKY